MTDSPAGKVEQTGGDAPKQDVPSIPKPRLDEALQKVREAEALAAEYAAKIKALEAQAQVPSKEVERLNVLERDLKVSRFASANQLAEEAAAMVLDLQAKGLSATAAMAAARADKPDLFVRKGDDAFRTPTHTALPPNRGSAVPDAETWNYQEEVKKARTSGRRGDVEAVAIKDIAQRMKAGGFKIG